MRANVKYSVIGLIYILFFAAILALLVDTTIVWILRHQWLSALSGIILSSLVGQGLYAFWDIWTKG
jgi:hypothetical protein